MYGWKTMSIDHQFPAELAVLLPGSVFSTQARMHAQR